MAMSPKSCEYAYHGLDPSAENVALITEALKALNIEAAREFVRLI